MTVFQYSMLDTVIDFVCERETFMSFLFFKVGIGIISSGVISLLTLTLLNVLQMLGFTDGLTRDQDSWQFAMLEKICQAK